MKGCYVLTPRRPSSGIICTPDRRAGNGHWKGLKHSEREIYGMDGVIGVKKELCFHTGQPGYRHKTNWKMIEYRLLQHYRSIECNHMKGGLDDWVLCKVYEDFDPDALSSQMGTRDIF